MKMSAAVAVNLVETDRIVAANQPAKKLSLVHVAEQPAVQLAAERMKSRVAVRSRLASLVEAGASMALFHAYRP
jgi:hypothetical protein